MNSDPTYDLGELCELADVTPRTVRYYLQQGLLPSPGRQGPATRYDRGHLDRLRLIKRLQQEHLPLAEIRRRLEELSDDAVRALAEQSPPAAATPSAGVVRDGSAIAYIRDVLGGGRTRQQSPQPSSPPLFRKSQRPSSPDLFAEDAAAASASEPPEPVAPPALYQRPMRDAGGGSPARSTWERITLAPDVELHVRRPLTRAGNKLVERLIAEARTLFDEDR
jgi:DNA-binding transcriptional MerR regulator